MSASSPDPLQPHPDTVFDVDWLSLRNAADSSARSAALTARLAAWLAQRAPNRRRPLQLSDLGSGSGANPRYLAPRLPGPQHWRLLDHDPRLLEHARQHCLRLCDRDGQPISADTEHIDLRSVRATVLANSDLITASAVLDLVDASWLENFADICLGIGGAVLITLSVDGRWHIDTNGDGGTHISPTADADPDDDFVRTAFNEHQRRAKGGARALGPDAATRLAELLQARGFEVQLAPSPWQLSAAVPSQAALARALISGWRDAAVAQRPQAGKRIENWHQRRQVAVEQAARNQAPLDITLGHLDLLALPTRAALMPTHDPSPSPSLFSTRRSQ